MTFPAPPHTPRYNDKTSTIWPRQEEFLICLPCPQNTFNEAAGQEMCAPCPPKHQIPYDENSNIKPTEGEDFIRFGCTERGYKETRMIQIITNLFGEKVGNLMKTSPLVKRLAVVFFILSIPMLIALFIIFLTYLLIDVGDFLFKISTKILPLQIQLAETAMSSVKYQDDRDKLVQKKFARRKTSLFRSYRQSQNPK